MNIKNIEIIYNLGNKTVLYLKCNRIEGLFECKMEERNNQCKHAHPMEQTRELLGTCDSGVSSCQSQHQYHF